MGKLPEATANFSEADLTTKRITDAVMAATASFSEKITSLENENKSLGTAVDKHANSNTHAELMAFCERLGPAKCPPAFLNMGVVEFMESLAAPGLGAGKVTVVSFSEEGGKKVETKTEATPLAWFKSFLEGLGPFISFGEQFGGLRSTGAEAATVVDPKRIAELREKAGFRAAEGRKS